VHDLLVFFAGALQYSTLSGVGEGRPALQDPFRPNSVGEYGICFLSVTPFDNCNHYFMIDCLNHKSIPYTVSTTVSNR